MEITQVDIWIAFVKSQLRQSLLSTKCKWIYQYFKIQFHVTFVMNPLSEKHLVSYSLLHVSFCPA